MLIRSFGRDSFLKRPLKFLAGFICLERKRDFVTREGRFATELAPVGLKWIDPSSGRVATLNNPPREAMAAMLRIIPSSPEWQAGAAGKLECHSKRLVSALNSVGQPTAADYKALGLPQKSENEVWGPFIAAAARLVGDTTPQGVRKFDDLVQLASQAVPPLGKRLKAVEVEKLFGFSEDTEKNILNGLTALRPFLDKAIESLTDIPSTDTLARLSNYFPPDPSRPAEPISDIRKIANSVRILLVKAREFLATPFDQLFKAVGKEIEQDRTIKTDFDANRDLIAIYANRTVFIHEGRFNEAVAKNVLQSARVVLHEALHNALNREEEDARYLEQGGLDKLAIQVAIQNADSYVAFVLHGNLEAAKISPLFRII